MLRAVLMEASFSSFKNVHTVVTSVNAPNDMLQCKISGFGRCIDRAASPQIQLGNNPALEVKSITRH